MTIKKCKVRRKKFNTEHNCTITYYDNDWIQYNINGWFYNQSNFDSQYDIISL